MSRLLLPLFCLLITFTSVAQSDTLLIDFGSILSPAPWNNVTDARNADLENLINAAGFTTAIDLLITDDFNAINTVGTDEPDPALGFVPTATGDSFFGNTTNFNNAIEPTAAVELSGLVAGEAYTFTLFASRNASDNREAAYELVGATLDTVYLDATDNETEAVTATVTADAQGVILLNVMRGPNNDNNLGFYYLGAMRVAYAAQDPVGPAGLELVTPDGGQVWQQGRTTTIFWNSSNIGDLLIEYSTDGGATYSDIATVPGFLQTYDWTVPNTPTTDALVRISTADLTDTSAAPFTIEANDGTCTIVVLGSSTAEGVGPTSLDSAWVNMFRAELAQQYTRYEVINLGKGGYTTAQILPTGTVIPPNINKTIDEERNMTKALSFDPFAVIVNMPSNDTGNGFPKEYQLENFAALAAAADSAGVAFYPFTTQPRNYNNPDNRALQACMKDSILAIYGDNAVDVWTGIADSDGFILPEFNADGIHLNNAGHKQLLRRTQAKMLDTITCLAPVSVFDLPENNLALEVFPNPFTTELQIRLPEATTATVRLEVIDLYGRVVARAERAGGNQEVSWRVPAIAMTGLYFLRVRAGERVGVRRVWRR